MLFTKASEYALLSLIYMAQKPLPQDVDKISNEIKISKSFLAKILQNLAKFGILNSYKGANGGFILAKDIAEISLKDIIEGAEKHAPAVYECSISKDGCKKGIGDTCQIWSIFNNLQIQVDAILGEITLKDIIEKQVAK